MAESELARVADAMVSAYTTHGRDATVKDMRDFFENDHVHLALIVDGHGGLVAAVERADLTPSLAGAAPAWRCGRIRGRVVRPSDELSEVTARLRRLSRRRMAVVDHAGRLVGLLCLKRSGDGYCTDGGIRQREHERRAGNTGPNCSTDAVDAHCLQL